MLGKIVSGMVEVVGFEEEICARQKDIERGYDRWKTFKH
jgi:hypothetical protein